MATSTHDDSVTAEGVTPFHNHRVSAAHSYRSLTPLNMDVSETGHGLNNNNNNNSSRLVSHGESTDEDGETGPRSTAFAQNGKNSAQCDENSAQNCDYLSHEASLEMIKLSLTSSSDSSEVKAGHTDIKTSHTEVTLTAANDDVTAANQNSLSDRTLGPELASLPTDGSCEDNSSEPVSLSHIQLQDMTATES